MKQIIKEAQNGSMEALAKLLEMFRPLVVSTASKFYVRGMDINDIIQIGYMYIIKCIKTYDPNKDTAFSSYVMVAVRNGIKQEIRRKSNSIISVDIDSIGEDCGEELNGRDPYEDVKDKLFRDYIEGLMDKAELDYHQKKIVGEIMDGNFNAMRYAKENNLSYTSVRYKKKLALIKLRNLIRI